MVLAVLAGTALAAAPAQAPDASAGGFSRLADLLEDEETRNALIAELRRLGDEQAAEALAAAEPTVPIARRIAALTQTIAEGVVDEGTQAARSLTQAWQRLGKADPAELAWSLGAFAVLVGGTLLAFVVLSGLAGLAFRALDRYAATPDGALAVLRRTLAVVGAVMVELVIVGLAWLSGYAIALFALGTPGAMSVQQSLFLNAFLMVGLVRIVVRIVFSKHGEHLRVVPMQAEEAAYWNAWLSRMVFFIGYGLLLVVPSISLHLSAELARATAIVIMLAAFVKAAVIVMQNRKRVRSALDMIAFRMQTPFARIAVGMGARVWHVVAIAYLGAILATAILYPQQALPFMLASTAQTLVAVAIGIFVSALLSQVILRRIRLGEETGAKFPLLEARLNAYIPTALKIARFAILAVVAAVILDAWSPFDLGAWLGSDAGALLLSRIVSVALIVALAVALWLLVASWIESRLGAGNGDGEPSPRTRTLLTIFRNAIAIALVVVTVMVALAEIGINIAPLLAGAGVLGLAIGFGAQKLVQDVITGVFIQLENAINVGDVVTAGGTTGVVEKLTIRSIGLRDLSGVYHLLPFSSVDMVSNFMRDFGYHVGEYGVAYREDTDQVVTHLQAAFDALRADPEHAQSILGELEVHGVTALADSAVNVRVRIKTLPGMQFGIGRAYNRLVKRHFDAAGIEIPFPHLTVYFGQDRQGNAPPARVELLRGRQRAPDAADAAGSISSGAAAPLSPANEESSARRI